MEGSGDEEGNGAHREALASTVRDQMTRASAHNNGLFTLRSDPIPILEPLSLVTVPRSRIENLQTYGVNSWPRDGFTRNPCISTRFFEFFQLVDSWFLIRGLFWENLGDNI